jgi:hypothetical protein
LSEVGGKSAGKVIEGRGAIWMAKREKFERLAVVCDSFLQILHFSQLPKVSGNNGG